jgi:hypothetical protein
MMTGVIMSTTRIRQTTPAEERIRDPAAVELAHRKEAPSAHEVVPWISVS